MSEEKICKNCGKQISEDLKICTYCGEKVERENYDTENGTNNYEVSPKNGMVCLLLLLFLGGFGAHRFYAGKIGSGFIRIILSLFTIFIIFVVSVLSSLSYYDEVGTILAGLIMFFILAITLTVWGIIDLISILRGKFKDSEGKYIKIK